MSEWILVPWHSVSPEIMDKSFRVTGMYNKMDDREDFIINDAYNENEHNYNGDDSSISSDSE
jgi:hypothetical protein